MQISKNVNKTNKAINSIPDSSDLMSKSYDHTSRPESRYGQAKTIDNSRFVKSIAT